MCLVALMPAFLDAVPPSVWYWIAGLSILTFISSMAILPMVIIHMAEDYFLPSYLDRSHKGRSIHPALRISTLILKNVLGAILLLAGLIMLFTPGQGLLTIFMGLVLMNFPGKRGLELKLVSRPTVFQALNWIRAKANRPPLLLPASS